MTLAMASSSHWRNEGALSKVPLATASWSAHQHLMPEPVQGPRLQDREQGCPHPAPWIVATGIWGLKGPYFEPNKPLASKSNIQLTSFVLEIFISKRLHYESLAPAKEGCWLNVHVPPPQTVNLKRSMANGPDAGPGAHAPLRWPFVWLSPSNADSVFVARQPQLAQKLVSGRQKLGRGHEGFSTW